MPFLAIYLSRHEGLNGRRLNPMPESHVVTPLLTERFARAMTLASEIHATQVRKGTDIPYVAHVLSVAALVLEAGGGEDCAIAALLHDAVEDSDDGAATLGRIRSEFGDKVAAIVEACSDTVAVPGLAKPDWADRKKAYLRHLKAEDDVNILLLSACDKLHNARAIAADLRTHGPRVWERFSAGEDCQLWYYGSLVKVFEEKVAIDSTSNRRLGPVAAALGRAVADMR
jgi:(p)ppGpp synthase/HD superfamily hydrolase